MDRRAKSPDAGKHCSPYGHLLSPFADQRHCFQVLEKVSLGLVISKNSYLWVPIDNISVSLGMFM